VSYDEQERKERSWDETEEHDARTEAGEHDIRASWESKERKEATKASA